MSSWHGGKGSAPRKGSDQKAYETNWDRIFNNAHQDKQSPKTEKNDTRKPKNS